MLQLPRSFFRQFRTVLRRSFSRVHSPVVFQGGPDGLSVRCQQEGIAVAYLIKGGQGADQFVLPVQALADVEGRGNELVTLDAKGEGKVQARWLDAGVPRVVEYESTKANSLPEFPETPARFSPQDETLLKALDDAMQCALHDSVRFALNKIQIRGSAGVIAATDGHQLLWQNGFQFPWADDLLVPRTNVFACRELAGEVGIAKTKTHFCVRAGPWTVFLPIDKEGRFPKSESIIPNPTNATHLNLTPENATFLANALPRLPGEGDSFSPVTLDLNGQVILRARADGQDRSTEVVLVGASVKGTAIRFAVNRQYLGRALALGFTEGHILGAETPMLFQDARRKYVIQGLGKIRVVAPSSNDLRMRSDSCASDNNNQPIQRRNPSMKSSRPHAAPVPVETNGADSGNGQHQQSGTFAALLEEGLSIQNALRDLLLRTNRLMVGLKAYRRQAKTMQSTLASLRLLPQMEP